MDECVYVLMCVFCASLPLFWIQEYSTEIVLYVYIEIFPFLLTASLLSILLYLMYLTSPLWMAIMVIFSLFAITEKAPMNFLYFPQSFKRKPGQADNERSMGDHSEHVHKRLRTVDVDSHPERAPALPQAPVECADAFEHIKQGSGPYDAQTYGTVQGRSSFAHRAVRTLLYDSVPPRCCYKFFLGGNRNHSFTVCFWCKGIHSQVQMFRVSGSSISLLNSLDDCWPHPNTALISGFLSTGYFFIVALRLLLAMTGAVHLK